MWLDFKGGLSAVIYSSEVRTVSYRPKCFSAQNAVAPYGAVTWVVGVEEHCMTTVSTQKAVA